MGELGEGLMCLQWPKWLLARQAPAGQDTACTGTTIGVLAFAKDPWTLRYGWTQVEAMEIEGHKGAPGGSTPLRKFRNLCPRSCRLHPRRHYSAFALSVFFTVIFGS